MQETQDFDLGEDLVCGAFLEGLILDDCVPEQNCMDMVMNTNSHEVLILVGDTLHDVCDNSEGSPISSVHNVLEHSDVLVLDSSAVMVADDNSVGNTAFANTVADNRQERSSGAKGKKPRRWTEDEHRRFIVAVERYNLKGKWKRVSRHHVKTRTPTQIASHAQKYFKRKAKNTRTKKRKSINDVIASSDNNNISNQPNAATPHVMSHDQLHGTEHYMNLHLPQQNPSMAAATLYLGGTSCNAPLVMGSVPLPKPELPLHYYQQIGANASASFTADQLHQFSGQPSSNLNPMGGLLQPQLPQSVLPYGTGYNYYAPASPMNIMNPNNVALQRPLDQDGYCSRTFPKFPFSFDDDDPAYFPEQKHT